MKNMRFILVMIAVLAVCVGLAGAQVSGEPMEGRSRNHTGAGGGNVYTCPTSNNSGSPPCGIAYRMYAPNAAGNAAINAVIDGNPIFRTSANGSYVSDVGNSSNWYGANHASFGTSGKGVVSTGADTGYSKTFTTIFASSARVINALGSNCVADFPLT